jgi:hypothetical protein
MVHKAWVAATRRGAGLEHGLRRVIAFERRQTAFPELTAITPCATHAPGVRIPVRVEHLVGYHTQDHAVGWIHIVERRARRRAASTRREEGVRKVVVVESGADQGGRVIRSSWYRHLVDVAYLVARIAQAILDSEGSVDRMQVWQLIALGRSPRHGVRRRRQHPVDAHVDETLLIA